MFRARKPAFTLHDTQFTGKASSSSCYKSTKPSFFTWNRKLKNLESAFFTDSSLKHVSDSPEQKSIAWLVESPKVFPGSLSFVTENHQKFDYVLTHQAALLGLDPKVLFCPVGGSWIKDTQWKVYKKSKMLSLIASSKKSYKGHQLRHAVASRFSKSMDLFGRAYKPVKHKVEALKDYRYSIVIENCRSDFYFTEKLIDAFACGTVPVYWGCPSIGKFFDERGIICFTSIGELPQILSTLSDEDYHNRLEGIRANFNEARKYRLAEDWMWNNYKEKIF